ncbi:MAG TPA: hypothetical protein EYP19_01730, partial [Desulfobacterales bacterium]|nr:hypothetical protein [Desulfobacterales bacterium]
GIAMDAPAFLPATKTVEDGEIVNIGGMDFQFFSKYRSDDYSLTVWLPKQKAALSNLYWPGAALLYAPRGGGRFHPLEWIAGLKLTRDLQPEILISVHSQAVVGKEKAREILLNYMDLISLTYDQSLRGMLQGLGPDELRHFVYKPKHLSEPPYNKDLFGETAWYTPDIYDSAFGWFNRDAATLYQLPPAEQAKRVVKLMGGEEKVLAEAQKAYDQMEYAWSVQLADYLI